MANLAGQIVGGALMVIGGVMFCVLLVSACRRFK